MLTPGQVPHRSNSSQLFWNLEDPVLVQHCPIGENTDLTQITG